MELLLVRCNHCGAALDVGGQTRFVTCQFCHSQLEVKRTDSSAFTEVVQQILQNTVQMAGNLEVIELQNELERLDREWSMNKEQFYTTGEEGQRQRPSSGGSVIGGILGIGFLIFWIGSASSMGAPPFFPLFGFAMLGIIIFNIVSNLKKSVGLIEAEGTYNSQRAALLRRIESARVSRK